MQPRRKLPLIILLLVTCVVGGTILLSYTYVPEPTQREVVKDIELNALKASGSPEQPVEYP